MAGTKAGGAKARETNKSVYGEDFYKRIGSMGGSVSHPETRYFRMYPGFASTVGVKGGMKSRRGDKKPEKV